MPDFMPEFFVKGGPVMWPLLACSLIAVTIVVERILFWWRERGVHEDGLIERIVHWTENGEYSAALEAAAQGRSAVARVLHAGLQHREHGLSEAMQVEAERQVDRMKQGLRVLDTIITMAPLLGIIGTVTGIISAFELLGGGEVVEPRGVTAGIAEALITTAAGLIIALGTLVPYNTLVAKTQRTARRIEQTATHFEVSYRRSLGQNPASSALHVEVEPGSSVRMPLDVSKPG